MRDMRKYVALILFVSLGCSRNGSVTLPSAPVSDRAARAVDLGRVAPDTQLDIVIGLSLHDNVRLHKLVAERPSSDAGMAPEEFADRFAPSRAQYQRVVGWLRAHQLIVTRTAAGRTTVSVHGTAAAIERLFTVELHEFIDDAGPFRAASGPLALTPELIDVVSGVVGLGGEPGWGTHLYAPDLGNVNPLTPTAVHMLYNSTAIVNPGMGASVAILGAGNPPDPEADVHAFMTSFKPYGMTVAPSYSQVLLGGANRDPSGTASGEYIENCLDADMVLGMAPLASVTHVLVATNSPGLFTDGISYIVNSVASAHAVTVSFGTCERGAAGSAVVVDALLQQAQAEGQQWFFSSGDTGTDGCRDGSGNKQISAGWPASSPYAVGVGGTMLDANGIEVAWNESTASGATGGGAGPSEMYVKPAYQMGVTPNDGARDEADVSGIAGGAGVYMMARGQKFGVGGTSAAAPIWAGVWALVVQGKGGAGLTDGLTRIYAAGKTNGFNDIIKGDNGGPDGTSPGFPAGTFYDLATGWGTPNVANLIAHIP
jgi:kumamolisin